MGLACHTPRPSEAEMKLMFCKECRDVLRLTYAKRSCLCGSCEGHYLSDGLKAEITGLALAIGFLNDSFFEALRRRKKDVKIWDLLDFEAFFLASDTPNVTIEEEE